MSMVVVAFVGLCLYAMIRILNLASPCLPPGLYAKTKGSEFVQAIIASCPILREPYIPPFVWGKSGHLQTVVYAKMGRMRVKVPSGARHCKILPDGSTLTFDLYEPTLKHKSKGDFSLLVCPGIGSNSESGYIQTLVNYALSFGYRIAVLNHLGSIKTMRLTAPRIFTYGGTDDFHIMRQEVQRIHPHSRLILVGLSMGANIVLKYLGEDRKHQEEVLCAFSICQGYNIKDAKHLLLQWENMRRAYLYTMTANQMRLILHHREILLAEENLIQFNLDADKIETATTLEELDVHFSCKVEGYEDVDTYYEQNSCSKFINNIDVPLFLLNAEDDPIVPPALFKYAREYAETHARALFVVTKHGGHLGYFEGGFLHPSGVSWLDRYVCQVADAVIALADSKSEGAACDLTEEHHCKPGPESSAHGGGLSQDEDSSAGRELEMERETFSQAFSIGRNEDIVM